MNNTNALCSHTTLKHTTTKPTTTNTKHEPLINDQPTSQQTPQHNNEPKKQKQLTNKQQQQRRIGLPLSSICSQLPEWQSSSEAEEFPILPPAANPTVLRPTQLSCGQPNRPPNQPSGATARPSC
jgi:hypothetical protein